MKWLKTYKLFESNQEEASKDLIESLLFDFSDEDIPVEVEFYKPDPLNSEDNRILILIGDEDKITNYDPNHIDLPMYDNIDNLSSIDEYLVDLGYQLKSIACWIKDANEPISGVKTQTVDRKLITIYFFKFSNFIEKIKYIENYNREHPALWHKTFKLIDICYEK